MVISNVSSSENFTSDVRAQIKQILAKGISNPETIPSLFENSKGDEYMFSTVAQMLSQKKIMEEEAGVQAVREADEAFVRAGVEEYLKRNPTGVSGMTERGTVFTLNLETPDNMQSIGHYFMTFTSTDGSTQKFDLMKGAGFRELEDGTILQFSAQELSEEEQKALGTASRSALIGTEGQDILIVDNTYAPARYVDGKGGNDIIIALGSQNGTTINGGDGDDQILVAGETNFMGLRGYEVTIHGGNGNDTITYQSHLDKGVIAGDGGDDTIQIEGYIGFDATVNGGEGNDRITQKGTTVTYGTIDGGSGNDVISIEGDDVLVVGNINGGDGDDSINLAAKNWLSAYRIDGGDGDDEITITGETVELYNTLDGGDGDDTISVKAHKIVANHLHLTGGEGNDRIELNAKLVEVLNSVIDGGKGDDSISISGTKVEIQNSTISGGEGRNTIILKADYLDVRNSSIDRDSFVSSENLTIKNSNMLGQFVQNKKMSIDTLKDSVQGLASDISKLDNADEMLSDLVNMLEKNKGKDFKLIANDLEYFSNRISEELKNQSGQKVNAYA